MAEMLDSLPEASLARHVAILGTSDAGKTYAAKGEVERLLDAGARVCVIDPTGVWYGLRLAPDGVTASRFDVVVFGGRHADIDIGASDGAASGERLARLIADGDFSAIIDVSRLSVGARTRLFAEFSEALAQFNTRPLHLVIDEAHLFAPQGRVQDPMSGRMLAGANHLVSAGRALGLRVMLLSQRPAKLHKDSLTQVQTLVAMLCVAPQDRKAVADWIADSADVGQGRTIVASLSSLPVGEGWIWAPRLEVLARVKFRPIGTFDSSASPEGGADRPTARLQAIDLAAIRATLAIEPDAEASPAVKAKALKGFTEADLDRARAEGYERGLLDGERREWRRWMDRSHAEHLAKLEEISAALAADQSPPRAEPARKPKPAPKVNAKPAPSAGTLGDAAENIITAARMAPRPVSWTEAGLLAGVMPHGGHFNGLRKQLRDAGWIDAPENDLVEDGPLNPAPVLRDNFQAKLTTAASGRVFARLWVAGPLTRAQLADQLGIAPQGGFWNQTWKAVRTSPLFREENGRWDIAPILRELKEADSR